MTKKKKKYNLGGPKGSSSLLGNYIFSDHLGVAKSLDKGLRRLGAKNIMRKYNGPKHEQGGISIDKHGRPTNKFKTRQVAEVEGGELDIIPEAFHALDPIKKNTARLMIDAAKKRNELLRMQNLRYGGKKMYRDGGPTNDPYLDLANDLNDSLYQHNPIRTISPLGQPPLSSSHFDTRIGSLPSRNAPIRTAPFTRYEVTGNPYADRLNGNVDNSLNAPIPRGTIPQVNLPGQRGANYINTSPNLAPLGRSSAPSLTGNFGPRNSQFQAMGTLPVNLSNFDGRSVPDYIAPVDTTSDSINSKKGINLPNLNGSLPLAVGIGADIISQLPGILAQNRNNFRFNREAPSAINSLRKATNPQFDRLSQPILNARSAALSNARNNSRSASVRNALQQGAIQATGRQLAELQMREQQSRNQAISQLANARIREGAARAAERRRVDIANQQDKARQLDHVRNLGASFLNAGKFSENRRINSLQNAIMANMLNNRFADVGIDDDFNLIFKK